MLRMPISGLREGLTGNQTMLNNANSPPPNQDLYQFSYHELETFCFNDIKRKCETTLLHLAATTVSLAVLYFSIAEGTSNWLIIQAPLMVVDIFCLNLAFHCWKFRSILTSYDSISLATASISDLILRVGVYYLHQEKIFPWRCLIIPLLVGFAIRLVLFNLTKLKSTVLYHLYTEAIRVFYACTVYVMLDRLDAPVAIPWSNKIWLVWLVFCSFLGLLVFVSPVISFILNPTRARSRVLSSLLFTGILIMFISYSTYIQSKDLLKAVEERLCPIPLSLNDECMNTVNHIFVPWIWTLMLFSCAGFYTLNRVARNIHLLSFNIPSMIPMISEIEKKRIQKNKIISQFLYKTNDLPNWVSLLPVDDKSSKILETLNYPLEITGFASNFYMENNQQ